MKSKHIESKFIYLCLENFINLFCKTLSNQNPELEMGTESLKEKPEKQKETVNMELRRSSGVFPLSESR